MINYSSDFGKTVKLKEQIDWAIVNASTTCFFVSRPSTYIPPSLYSTAHVLLQSQTQTRKREANYAKFHECETHQINKRSLNEWVNLFCGKFKMKCSSLLEERECKMRVILMICVDSVKTYTCTLHSAHTITVFFVNTIVLIYDKNTRCRSI